MAIKYKRNSGLDLSLTTSWSDTGPTGLAAAAIPGAADTAQFDATSLGGTYTNALTCAGITFNSSTVAPTFSGTVTTGASGWTFAATNPRQVTLSGTMAVGATSQTWTLYHTTANTAAIALSGTFTGNAGTVVTLATASTNKGILGATSTTSTFAGTVALGNNTVVNTTSAAGTGTGAGLGNAATIRIDGTGSGISSSSGTGTFVSAIVANNSWAVGVGTLLQAVNVTGTTTFGSGGAYTLTTAATTTLTGNVSMTGNSHVVTAGAATTIAGTLTLANSPSSCTLQSGAGALTISNTVTCGSGSHTIRSNGAGNVSVTGAVDCGTGNQTFACLGAGTLSMSNTLTMGAGSHTFDANGSDITVSGQMTGTNGFTKTSTGVLTVTNTTNTLSGNVTVSAGDLFLGGTAQSGNVLPSVGTISTSTTTTNLIVLSNADYTFPNTISGSGNALFQATGTNGITVPDTIMAGMNNASAFYGSGVRASAVTSNLRISDFPTKLCWFLSGASPTGNIRYIKAAATTFSGAVNLFGSGVTGTATAGLITDNASSADTLTIAGNVSPGASTITFSLSGTNTGDNTISGIISAATQMVKAGTGKWVLSGTNTYTGTNTLTAGTLLCTNGAALGGSAATAAGTLTAGTLQVSGSITLNKVSSTFTNNGSTIQNVSGTNTITFASLVMGASFAMTATAGTLTMTNTITTGATTRALTLNGPGTIALTNTASTYVSATTIDGAVVEVTKLANAAVNSSLGAPASAQAPITVAITAGNQPKLRLTGSTTDTCNRQINFSGVSSANFYLENTGSGTLTYTGLLNTAGTSQTWILTFGGSNTNANTYTNSLTNGTPSNAVITSVTKQGAGTWYLTSATHTYTGATTVEGGTLNLGSINRSLTGNLNVNGGGTVAITTGNTISANVDFNAVGGGTITAQLTGAGKTITVNSAVVEGAPAKLQPDDATNGNNNNTGAGTINGCIDLVSPTALDIKPIGKGLMLGQTNTVTVGATGIIRTKGGAATAQDGHARYYNLTFANGGKLKIGLAA